MKYIAYGSNMNIGQMARRCPDAKLLGTGWVKDMRLAFRGRMAGNAHATLVPALRGKGFPRQRVPVVVWELSNQDEHNLDCYEGAPTYYRKERCSVTMNGGRTQTGLIYLMNGGHIGLPSASYYRGIRDAYLELGLGSQIKPILEKALAASRVWCGDENTTEGGI